MIFILLIILILILYLYMVEVKKHSRGLRSAPVSDSDLVSVLNLPPEKLKDVELPEYKFYHLILGELFLLRKRFGADIRDILCEMKSAIIKDKKLSKEVKKIKLSSMTQVVAIVFISIAFNIVASLVILNIALDIGFLLMFVLWNFLGLGLLFALNTYSNYFSFRNFDRLFSALYSVKALFSISRPLNEIVEKSNIMNCDDLVNVKSVSSKAISSLKLVKETGTFDAHAWDLHIIDLWNLYEDRSLSYKRKIKMFQFLILSLFCLPSYLYSIVNLLENLLLTA